MALVFWLSFGRLVGTVVGASVLDGDDVGVTDVVVTDVVACGVDEYDASTPP